jgi:hypothetical protein
MHKTFIFEVGFISSYFLLPTCNYTSASLDVLGIVSD